MDPLVADPPHPLRPYRSLDKDSTTRQNQGRSRPRWLGPALVAFDRIPQEMFRTDVVLCLSAVGPGK